MAFVPQEYHSSLAEFGRSGLLPPVHIVSRSVPSQAPAFVPFEDPSPAVLPAYLRGLGIFLADDDTVPYPDFRPYEACVTEAERRKVDDLNEEVTLSYKPLDFAAFSDVGLGFCVNTNSTRASSTLPPVQTVSAAKKPIAVWIDESSTMCMGAPRLPSAPFSQEALVLHDQCVSQKHRDDGHDGRTVLGNSAVRKARPLGIHVPPSPKKRKAASLDNSSSKASPGHARAPSDHSTSARRKENPAVPKRAKVMNSTRAAQQLEVPISMYR